MKLSSRHIVCVALFLLMSICAKAQDIRILNLEEATGQALQSNKLLQVQIEKARESGYKIKAVSAKGKPQLLATGTYLHFFDENNFVVPAGGRGSLLEIPIPFNNFTLFNGQWRDSR